ncbi:hypothetical protein CEXT_682001 [Caerostris extrusa]|uniref:Uncharacterized protein n=1 Tax=Caerostris extrusa TaxID=172846 RepID=A0AAV4WDC1_CAEEX|nr:hypothetical protein CEXT_682001 [Caerostris extrusa]
MQVALGKVLGRDNCPKYLLCLWTSILFVHRLRSVNNMRHHTLNVNTRAPGLRYISREPIRKEMMSACSYSAIKVSHVTKFENKGMSKNT